MIPSVIMKGYSGMTAVPENTMQRKVENQGSRKNRCCKGEKGELVMLREFNSSAGEFGEQLVREK